MINVLLYFSLALEIFGVMVVLAEARKPRVRLKTSEVITGIVVWFLYFAPVPWLLATDQPTAVTVIAALFAVSAIPGLAAFVQEVYGVRGPRTPFSVLLWTVAGVLGVAGWIAILAMT